jgi:hypothetical protein
VTHLIPPGNIVGEAGFGEFRPPPVTLLSGNIGEVGFWEFVVAAVVVVDDVGAI